MGRFSLKRLPSPALAVAFLALVAALSGTAIALPGRNTVDSGDLKRGAVKNRDIARGAVTGVKVRNRTLTGAKIRNNALTGVKIDESTLGTVPSAERADTAANATNASQLGGLSLRGLSQWVLVGTAGDVVSSSGDITVTKLAAAGRYRVNFPNDVSQCGYNANAGTSGTASDATDFSNRMVMLGRGVAANQVQVETASDAGVSANNPFMLTIQC